jgi:predicted methyltransferase
MRRVLAKALALGACLAVACATTDPRPAIEAAIAAPDRSAADRERDARDHPAEVLALLGLAPGMKVIDVFAGGGYYAELAARVVGPGGHVWLHNNAAYEAFAGKELAERLAARPLPQLERYDREANALDLPDASLDAALLVMAYHDLYWVKEGWAPHGAALFASLHRMLKPGGRILVVDHAAAPGTGKSSVQDLHRIDETFAKIDIESRGFRLVGTSDVLRNPADDHTKSVFDDRIRGRTDRFVLVLEKLPMRASGAGAR